MIYGKIDAYSNFKLFQNICYLKIKNIIQMFVINLKVRLDTFEDNHADKM